MEAQIETVFKEKDLEGVFYYFFFFLLYIYYINKAFCTHAVFSRLSFQVALPFVIVV